MMLIRVGYDLLFDYPAPTPLIALLFLHPSRQASVRRGDCLRVEPRASVSLYTDGFGNRCGRLQAPAGPMRFWNDAIVEDSGQPDPPALDADQHDLGELPAETLQFLIASRYCEVDRMVDLAWRLFGSTPKTGARVQAICAWVHRHLRFDYLQARPTRTAYEAYQERVGVCRDFAHLAITFCRCLNIPARYCTGYLGDIGAPPAPDPMDFSAWFEAYLGGEWRPFDARHNTPRIGRVLMARGRDAADVALLTAFGPSRLERFTVWTKPVGEEALSPAALPSGRV